MTKHQPRKTRKAERPKARRPAQRRSLARAKDRDAQIHLPLPVVTSSGRDVQGRKGESTVLYFAYGSNLDIHQMAYRCPDARHVARAVLPGFAITFAGYSHRWRGAVANVVPKRGKGAAVEGLLYCLTRFDLLRLDRFEGVPAAYRRTEKVVVDELGRRKTAYIYFQPPGAFDVLVPGVEYWEVIFRAYERLGFDLVPLLSAGGIRP